MDELIVCSGLTKRFRGLVAVDELDLTVRKGDIYGFLGPNGAGKSTTLRMMVGLIRPTRGCVKLFGHDVWKNRQSALRKAGALIEEPSFYKYLSGRENLIILSKTGRQVSHKEIDETLDMVGLLKRADDKVKSYSQGMRQRLGIAQAILGKPELVLLDEPTNGLDPQGMREVRELIGRLSSEMGITVFLSSHLLHEVEQVCGRIAVINKGKVIESGPVAELLGSRSIFEITTDRADAAASAVKESGKAAVMDVSPASFIVDLDGTEPADLNRFLVERGFAISGLAPRPRSLEELYLELMRDEGKR